MPGAQRESCGFEEEDFSKISLESAYLHRWSQNQKKKKGHFCAALFKQTHQYHENNRGKECLSSLVPPTSKSD